MGGHHVVAEQFLAAHKDRTRTRHYRSRGLLSLTQIGYEFWPEALEQTIRYASAQAKVPVYVTDRGIGTEDDTRRIEYIRRALAGVRNSLKDGMARIP